MPADPVEDPSGGWDALSGAWVEEQGEHGHCGRRHVLDAPMTARPRPRPRLRPCATVLDAGCGEGRFCIDLYLEERAVCVSRRGIRVQNRHRPFGTCMALLPSHGLALQCFAGPEPEGGDPAAAGRCRRVPFSHITEWSKPGV